MQKFLRSCYKEAELYGANAITFENRRKTIERIINDKEIGRDIYVKIACWLMGNEAEETEDCLVILEKNFCMEDKEFSIKDKKEMQVLSSVLLLQYCKKCSSEIIPLILLCGNGIGKSLPCQSVYYGFQNLVENNRISYRKTDESQYQLKLSRLKSLKNAIAESRKSAGEEEFEYSTHELDLLMSLVEVQDTNIKMMNNEINGLQHRVQCQREESDVLWWLINEWSDIYRKSFSDMTMEELAISSAIELDQKSQFVLLPYSAEGIISSLFHKYKDESEMKSLSDYMSKIDESILDLFGDIEKKSIREVQPILEAFCCMKNCGSEKSAWNGMLNKKYGFDADDIKLTPEDFAKHFSLELELFNCL